MQLVTLIKLVATLEHGDTTVLRHLSWTTKLHTATITSHSRSHFIT